METMNIQSVAEKNIVSVVLADIQPSNYNPRKNFDVASLAELALNRLDYEKGIICSSTCYGIG